MALSANVAVATEVESAVARAVGAFGRLDVLYNNAGVNSAGSVADATEDDWDRCFAVNAKGTFLCSRAAVPQLEKTGGGAIVNQGSVAGLVGVPNFAAYCAAKGAVVALTRLPVELRCAVASEHLEGRGSGRQTRDRSARPLRSS